MQIRTLSLAAASALAQDPIAETIQVGLRNAGRAWGLAGLARETAIAQQFDAQEVLMLAWMNRAAIDETLATGFACYWSRSRQSFWRKGETSGCLQRVVETEWCRHVAEAEVACQRVDRRRRRGRRCLAGRCDRRGEHRQREHQ